MTDFNIEPDHMPPDEIRPRTVRVGVGGMRARLQSIRPLYALWRRMGEYPDAAGLLAALGACGAGITTRTAKGVRATLYLALAVITFTACAPGVGSGIVDEGERRAYVQEHPDLPEHIAEAILDGRPARGMTPAQVKAALGRPERMNEYGLGSVRTARVQLVYGSQWDRIRTLYVTLRLKDGAFRVVSWTRMD